MPGIIGSVITAKEDEIEVNLSSCIMADQSDFSIGGVYFSYTPPRRCIFFAWGLDLLRIWYMGPWYKSVTSLGSTQVSPV